MGKERIIKALEGLSGKNIDKYFLGQFGFFYISDFMTRADRSIVADVGLGDTYDIDCELWIDFLNQRVLLYAEHSDLHFLRGELTKTEEKIYN